jgi:uncharacterized protein YijF (DUF1287 family)
LLSLQQGTYVSFLRLSFLFFALCLSAQVRAASLPVVDHAKLVTDARSQIGVTLLYDSSYHRLAYPNGDVPPLRGVCADVIVRALRAQHVDLQMLIHEDMQKHFSAYPQIWGAKTPDSNIDHRRVPNIRAFFTRAGKSLPITANKSDYQPGDVVVWNLSGRGSTPHIGIVSDKKSADGVPLVIHNIGWGTREEDILFDYKITGHFRL